MRKRFRKAVFLWNTRNEIQHVYTSLKAFSLFLFVYKDLISCTAKMDQERQQNKTTPLKRSASISPSPFYSDVCIKHCFPSQQRCP